MSGWEWVMPVLLGLAAVYLGLGWQGRRMERKHRRALQRAAQTWSRRG